MSKNKPRVRLLERRFLVKVSKAKAWAHLERVEDWPTWARHIRAIDVRPKGSLSSETEGDIRLKNGIRSTFKMDELNSGVNWKWSGPFLWLMVHYDHHFESVSESETAIEFVLDGEGFGAGVIGRVFAAIYARSLDRAIPNLIEELEA